MNKRNIFGVIYFLAITIFFTNEVMGINLQSEEALDKIIDSYMSTYKIPGIELAIAKDNKIIYSKGFGKTPEGVEVTADTPMYIGSVSKSFTALSIMQLVEKGEIDLDATVIDYLPWFKVSNEEISKKIKVKDLLNHRSGLSENSYFKNLAADTSLEYAVRDLSEAKPVAEPGTTFNYFNPNYQILGLIIEEVSGLSYSEYVKKNILDPLSMNNTFLGKNDIESRVNKGYTSFYGFPVKKKEPFVTYALPEGYIVSTANDMLKYLIALNSKGLDSDVVVLSQEGLRKMYTLDSQRDSNYSMGWNISHSSKGYTVIHSSGDLNTYHCHILMIPEKAYSIVLMTNQNSYLYSGKIYSSLIKTIVDQLVGNNVSLNMPKINMYLQFFGLILFLFIMYQVIYLRRIVIGKLNLKVWKKSRIILSILADMIIPVILLVFVPKFISQYIKRAFDLKEAFDMLPDISLTFIIISILFVVKAIVKILARCLNMSANN